MGSGRWALVCVVGLACGRVLPPARRPRRPPAAESAAAAAGRGGARLADAHCTVVPVRGGGRGRLLEQPQATYIEQGP